jgi:hypothetical protein
MKKEMRNKKRNVLPLIVILIIGLFAISWIIREVKADVISNTATGVDATVLSGAIDSSGVSFNWGGWQDTVVYSFNGGAGPYQSVFFWYNLLTLNPTALLFLRTTSTVEVTYNCYQWEPRIDNKMTPAQRMQRCELCNSQGDFLDCSEYQCKSLGRGCMIVNGEGNGRPLCILNNTYDIIPPTITPWEDALLDDFVYTPDGVIAAPDRGVKIVYTGHEDVTSNEGIKCAPPYTPVAFGVQLNEPGKCKISKDRVNNYSSMPNNSFIGGIEKYDYNHSMSLSLPSEEALAAENITVNNGGKYQLYVRCKDYQGNENIANFVFKFCISQGPDTTPPLILGTSLLNDQPIASGQTSIRLDLYVNEPSECRWSHLDKNFDAMEENMTCDTSVAAMNSRFSYTCRTNLTGLKDNQNNTFYFRCKDQPYFKDTPNESKRNANTQSYRLNIIGTGPLIISSISPNGTTIYDSTDSVKVDLIVNTFGGFDNGKATCYFSETGRAGTYIEFFNGPDVASFTQSENKQELWLSEGNYTYFIQCLDKGGNMDSDKINFSIDIDKIPPSIIRVYKEDESLKIITNEESECFYSNIGCSYDIDSDGETMSSSDGLTHLTSWNIEKDLYIKCRDKYGNRPGPDVCSLIARPFDLVQTQGNE